MLIIELNKERSCLRATLLLSSIYYREKKMKVNKSVIQEIINKIEEYDTIALFRHVYPDQDSYGSQVALEKYDRKKFPRKNCLLNGKT